MRHDVSIAERVQQMPDVINTPTLGLYVALIVALIVVLGFALYLWRISRAINDLGQMVERRDETQQHQQPPHHPGAEPVPPQPEYMPQAAASGSDRQRTDARR